MPPGWPAASRNVLGGRPMRTTAKAPTMNATMMPSTSETNSLRPRPLPIETLQFAHDARLGFMASRQTGTMGG